MIALRHNPPSTRSDPWQWRDSLQILLDSETFPSGVNEEAADNAECVCFEGKVNQKLHGHLPMPSHDIGCGKEPEELKADCGISQLQCSGKFIFFPKLPAEIQIQIWEACVDQVDSRIVCFNWHDQFQHRGWKGQLGPDLLRVCVDSRGVALRRYQWFEATRVDGSVKHGYFIDPKSDIVFFDSSMHLLTYPPHMIEDELEKVPKWFELVEKFGTIAILPGKDPHRMGSLQFPSFWHRMRAVFPKLKAITFVFNSRAPKFEFLVSRWTRELTNRRLLRISSLTCNKLKRRLPNLAA